MPHTDAPVRLADFTVRLFLPADLLAYEARVNDIVRALDHLDLRRRIAHLVRYELETRPCWPRLVPFWYGLPTVSPRPGRQCAIGIQRPSFSTSILR